MQRLQRINTDPKGEHEHGPIKARNQDHGAIMMTTQNTVTIALIVAVFAFLASVIAAPNPALEMIGVIAGVLCCLWLALWLVDHG